MNFTMSQCVFEKVFSLNEILNLIKSEEFNNLNHNLLRSVTPVQCVENSCILGVDEAGRGPVLGPMVYSVFYCSTNNIETLKQIGCTDSKTLTEKKRESIFEHIIENKDKVGWIVDIISPNKISNCMQKRIRYSLNEIAQKSTVKLIKTVLESGVIVSEIYVDTIGPPDKYQDKLSKLFPNIKIVVEKKADSLHPIVGGASICAKVIRDIVIKNWKFSEFITASNNEIGTGYPGDPKTKKFLLDNRDDIFGFPNLVRFSWSTATKILKTIRDVEWGNETQNIESSNIQTYLNLKKQEIPLSRTAKIRLCNFFKERGVVNIDNF